MSGDVGLVLFLCDFDGDEQMQRVVSKILDAASVQAASGWICTDGYLERLREFVDGQRCPG